MKIVVLPLLLGLATPAHAAHLTAAQRARANRIIQRSLPAYYGARRGKFGAVMPIGDATLVPTRRRSVVKASGEFNGNLPWGAAANYRYFVGVNLATGLIQEIKKPVVTQENY